MANPDLDPESMMNYEISLSRTFFPWISASVTAYYSKGDNMIQQVDMKNLNTGRFINKGVEVTLNSKPHRRLSLMATYSYLHSSLRNLTGAPRHQYYIGADWNVTDRLNISTDLKGIANLYVHDTVKNQSYALLNLKATYRACRYASVFVRLENITDASYMINRGYEMPGFTALGGIKLNF